MQLTRQFDSSSARLQSAIPSHIHVFCKKKKTYYFMPEDCIELDQFCNGEKFICLPKYSDHLYIGIHHQHTVV